MKKKGEYKYRKRQSCTAGIINNLKPIDIKNLGEVNTISGKYNFLKHTRGTGSRKARHPSTVGAK